MITGAYFIGLLGFVGLAIAAGILACIGVGALLETDWGAAIIGIIALCCMSVFAYYKWYLGVMP
jgi:hypothetical protein